MSMYACTQQRSHTTDTKKHACTHSKQVSQATPQTVRHIDDSDTEALLRRRSRPIRGHREATTRAIEGQGATARLVGGQARPPRGLSEAKERQRGLLKVRRTTVKPVEGQASDEEACRTQIEARFAFARSVKGPTSIGEAYQRSGE